jgi:putative ABC transport system permease protein
VYRALLQLLPRSIRGRFAHDMEALLMERLDGAPGISARARIWMRACADVLAVALAEHSKRLRRSIYTGRRGGMDRWTQDLGHAVRTLARTPALTLMVVGTLALGIGTATATFSVVNAVLLKPLPYDEPERLVAVWPEQNFNAAMVRDLQEAAPALESVSGISGWTLTLTGEGEPLQVEGARVSTGHFRTLGVGPTLGRDFAPEEGVPGEDAVAILSHGLWVRAFGADPGVIGRTVDLASNDHPRRTVIGVMPPDFRPVRGDPDVWIPLALAAGTSVEDDETWYVNDRIARLAPGATIEQASEQVRSFARDIQARMDQAIQPSRVEIAAAKPLRVQKAGAVGPVMWVALGAVSLVLLIACANVANLLLARGEARQGDLAVRSALGAGRARVARLLLVETGIAGLAGGLAGIMLSFLLVRIVVALAPARFPRLDEIGVDGVVLAYALAATALASLGAGLVPALRASRVDATAALSGAARGASGRPRSKLTTTLVGAEIALALVVVVGSGLMLRSLHRMTSEDPGLDGAGVLVLQPSPPEGRYPDGAAFHAYYAQVLERVRAVPGVERASAIHLLPGTLNNWSFPTFVDGQEVGQGIVIPSVNFRVVWPEYFETVGMRLVAGRTLSETDGADAVRPSWSTRRSSTVSGRAKTPSAGRSAFCPRKEIPTAW